jgi:hypothetical protein
VERRRDEAVETRTVRLESATCLLDMSNALLADEVEPLVDADDGSGPPIELVMARPSFVEGPMPC